MAALSTARSRSVPNFLFIFMCQGRWSQWTRDWSTSNSTSACLLLWQIWILSSHDAKDLYNPNKMWNSGRKIKTEDQNWHLQTRTSTPTTLKHAPSSHRDVRCRLVIVHNPVVGASRCHKMATRAVARAVSPRRSRDNDKTQSIET